MSGGDAPRPYAVFDIDGVVADVRHRLHHLARKPKDWRAFFAAAASDPPLAGGVELALRQADEHELVWLTGRPEHLRRVTQRWLRAQGLPEGRLMMRPRGDYRPARLYKAEAIAQLAAERDLAVVVDDDPEVVSLLRGRGWPAQLADWVPYAEPLQQAQETDGRT